VIPRLAEAASALTSTIVNWNPVTTSIPDHAILVFGAAVGDDGSIRRPLARRLQAALAEAASDPGAVVIVSGGRVRGRPAEAPIMRDWLVSSSARRSRRGRTRATAPT
jgi:hypothetical protein